MKHVSVLWWNSSSFSDLLSLDLFGAELVAQTVDCITPQLAVPPAWKWRGLLTCSDWHWGQRPGLCPETDRTLRKINKRILISIYAYTYLRWMRKAEWMCMKRFTVPVWTGPSVSVLGSSPVLWYQWLKHFCLLVWLFCYMDPNVRPTAENKSQG